MSAGGVFFGKKLRFFTAHRARVEFLLPAFPAKSFSDKKVASTKPDKAEELALRSLFWFVKAVEEVYPLYRKGGDCW